MKSKEAFKETIINGYNFKGESLILGGAMLNGETLSDTFVKVPLKTLNRHGLIAGATGTGKTKTIQEHVGDIISIGKHVDYFYFQRTRLLLLQLRFALLLC